MTTLIQGAPLFDNVNPSVSGGYTNQLSMTNGVGPYTYTVTNPINGLTVYPQGRIAATNVLNNNQTYTVSGTVVDSASNTGTWLFNLSVASIISPTAKVVPINSPLSTVLPSGSEIQVPFNINPATGGTSSISDYGQIMEQHIETIVMTTLNERVMLPTFGTNVGNQLFAPISSVNNAVIIDNIQEAIKKWEPGVSVTSVKLTNNPQLSPTTLTITITFSVVPYNNISTVVVTTGGAIQQVTS